MGRLAAIIASLLLGSIAGLRAGAEPAMLMPKAWNGEALQADEGLFYLQSLILDSNAQQRQGSFSFVLLGKSQARAYSLQVESSGRGERPNSIWKLKADDYQIAQLQTIDKKGYRWSWKGPYRSTLQVKSRSLSNFGIWHLVELKKPGQLGLLIKPSENLIQQSETQGSIARVIDGLSGRVQAEFQRKAASRQGEIRAVITEKRSIGMYYKLNLFRQNQYAPAVASVIQSNEPDIRSCYTDFLERSEPVQGTLVYTLLLSHQTQSIKTLKIKRAEIKDERFLECLYYKFMALSFPLKESVLGELSLMFQVAGA